MKSYICHKRVEAAKIVAKECGLDNHYFTFSYDDGGEETLFSSDKMIARYEPVVGDYLVEYADGYRSFSPAKAFEEGYALEAEVPPAAPMEVFGIGEAVKKMMNGNAVARAGWNGKGLHLRLLRPHFGGKMTLPFVYMRTVQGDLVPWLCSQTDLLSIDWFVVS